MRLKIYLAGSIVGVSIKDLKEYFHYTKISLEEIGFQVFTPFIESDSLANKLDDEGKDPSDTARAIVDRDKWMVRTSDIILCNLLSGKERVSIGSVAEITLAKELGKHVIVIMQKENIHQHPFVTEAADVIFTDEEEAIIYLERIIEKS